MKRRPLMERVSEYVNQCDSLGWRPVFTHEQMRAIMHHGQPGDIFFYRSRQSCVSLLGVIVKVDDTPRPPMPSKPRWTTAWNT